MTDILMSLIIYPTSYEFYINMFVNANGFFLLLKSSIAFVHLSDVQTLLKRQFQETPTQDDVTEICAST